MTQDDHLLEELATDVEALRKELRQRDAQVFRRAWCRALFAWIEGTLADAKELRLTEDYWLLDEEDELALKDLRRDKKATESSPPRKAFLPLVDAAKLTVEAYAVHAGADSPIAPDDPGWQRLASASRIRNRVVHPKRHADLHISDEEVRLLHEAAMWFLEAITGVQDLYFRAELHRSRGRFKRAIRYFRRKRVEN